jgi:hypothetical protein
VTLTLIFSQALVINAQRLKFHQTSGPDAQFVADPADIAKYSVTLSFKDPKATYFGSCVWDWSL